MRALYSVLCAQLCGFPALIVDTCAFQAAQSAVKAEDWLASYDCSQANAGGAVALTSVQSMHTRYVAYTSYAVHRRHSMCADGVVRTDELLAIIDASTTSTKKQGRYLCRQGDWGDAMYIIVRGTVSIQILRNGEFVELVRRSAGDIVGEFALLNPGPRSANVVAVSEVEVLIMDGEAFERLRRNHTRKSGLRIALEAIRGNAEGQLEEHEQNFVARTMGVIRAKRKFLSLIGREGQRKDAAVDSSASDDEVHSGNRSA